MVRDTNQPPGEGWICLGVITGAVGVKGEVRVKTFTGEPEAIGDYGPLTASRSGRSFTVRTVRTAKGGLVLRIEGVNDRDAAEALKGEQLFIRREVLPQVEEDETYYHADLIGLVAEDEAGGRQGIVKAVYDFGAGDMLEVALDPGVGGKERVIMIPFTKASVPVVDVAGGRVRFVLPQGKESGGETS
jgi:16S rRNA processing protein RimM